MNKLLNMSSSPRMRSHETTHSIILGMAIAMLPATAFGVYYFGIHMLLVLIATVTACVLSEHVYEKLMKKRSTVSDYSALVAGMILALNIPPEIPVWIPALGGIFAIIVVKQLYDGLGQNSMSPALTARCFLLIPSAGKTTNFNYSGFDGVSGATPLTVLKDDWAVGVPTMFMGNIPDTVGEVSVIASLIGAAYLLAKEIISIRISGTYILTVVVFAILFGDRGFDLNYVVAHLCGGGLISGAFFMATDCVTSPIVPRGQTVFGILLDVLTGLFRVFGGSIEGVSYAIVINNILVPLIEKITLPKTFGKEDK